MLPRRAVFGAPIENVDGLGPDIISPIRTSTAKNNPIAATLLAARATSDKPNHGAIRLEPTNDIGGQLAGRRGAISPR